MSNTSWEFPHSFCSNTKITENNLEKADGYGK